MVATSAGSEEKLLVYFGTYTSADSRGIYVSRFDPDTGRLTPPELAAKADSPSFLAVHPDGRFLYAVSELSDPDQKKIGTVSAFRIDRKSGKLSLLNRQSSCGVGPCHLALDKTGHCLMLANYGDGVVAVMPVRPDGRLLPASAVIQHTGSSINPDRQEGPHAHSITVDRHNRFVLECDLGLDKVLAYQLDTAKCALVANDPPAVAIKAGSGPRHLEFHPECRLACMISELSSTLTLLSYDEDQGVLKVLQTVSTLPQGFKGSNGAAEVAFHPSGRFVYASNRGANDIAIFALDVATSKLSLVGHQPSGGKIPRHFAIDPAGRWLLAENQDSSNVLVFRIDPEMGRLTSTGSEIKVPHPACAVFVK